VAYVKFYLVVGGTVSHMVLLARYCIPCDFLFDRKRNDAKDYKDTSYD